MIKTILVENVLNKLTSSAISTVVMTIIS